jgi:hypothetical protein
MSPYPLNNEKTQDFSPYIAFPPSDTSTGRVQSSGQTQIREARHSQVFAAQNPFKFKMKLFHIVEERRRQPLLVVSHVKFGYIREGSRRSSETLIIVFTFDAKLVNGLIYVYPISAGEVKMVTIQSFSIRLKALVNPRCLGIVTSRALHAVNCVFTGMWLSPVEVSEGGKAI